LKQDRTVLSSAERREVILVVFNSAIREGLQLYSQIWHSSISNQTLNATSSNAFPALTIQISAMMIGIF
jgi:hypothetical protein